METCMHNTEASLVAPTTLSQRLLSLLQAVSDDLEQYLSSPEEYLPEYFESVADAVNEAVCLLTITEQAQPDEDDINIYNRRV